MLAAQPETGTTHISSRSHLNLTFNLYECGSAVLPAGSALAYPPEDAYALIYIANGQYSLSFDGFSNKAGEARGFFTFPESHYTLINTGEEPLHLTWVQFSGYLIDNYLNRANISRSRPLFLDPQNTVGTGMQYLWEASLHMPNRYCRMVARLYDIFSYLLDANPTKNSSGYVDSADFFAVKAAEFIERNYTRDVSVPQIASALGISRKHLYAVFNNILKISPKQYLIYYRIEKACDRLKDTRQSMQQVAETVGYANQFYFAKEFKRLTGMTPREYRKQPRPLSLFSYRTYLPQVMKQLYSK